MIVRKINAVLGSFLLIVGFIIGLTPSAFADTESGFNYTVSTKYNYATITGLTPENNNTDIVIPSIIAGYPVKIIDSSAFYNNQLTSVIIPNTVTHIGTTAFANNNLTSVEIPNSVTTIYGTAFANNNLTSITLGNSLSIIPFGAFRDNNLTSVTIPSSVISIDDLAFRSNELTSVIFEGPIKSIGPHTFDRQFHTPLTEPSTVWFTNPALTSQWNNTVPQAMTIYSKAPSHTVTFDTDGGSSIDSKFVNDKDSVSRPSNPTKIGYTFAGWHIGSSNGILYDFDSSVTDDLTLYALWIADSDTNPSNTEGNNDLGVVNMYVDESITLTLTDDVVNLSGLPGESDESTTDNQMSYLVESNGFNGYTVTIKSDTSNLSSNIVGNQDSIPFSSITVDGDDSTTGNLSNTVDLQLALTNARSIEGGDSHDAQFSMDEIPWVNADDYTGTVTLTATSNS